MEGGCPMIHNKYHNIDELLDALRAAGLESSNLIVGIDFTKSNEWTGRHSNDGLSLHSTSTQCPNPYEHAISIIANTLSEYDEDQMIPCFGFGDVKTHDQRVFSFYPDGRPCCGLDGVLARYRELLPHIILSGPTSFAPIINAAVEVVKQSGGQYHILLIIADGQVTGNIGLSRGRLSPQEKASIDAIVNASNYPLSIVLVGVGDGPWDTMQQFDDAIPQRRFDNFQFVNYTEIVGRNRTSEEREDAFALAALQEIPDQYQEAKFLPDNSCNMAKSPFNVIIPSPIP